MCSVCSLLIKLFQSVINYNQTVSILFVQFMSASVVTWTFIAGNKNPNDNRFDWFLHKFGDGNKQFKYVFTVL